MLLRWAGMMTQVGKINVRHTPLVLRSYVRYQLRLNMLTYCQPSIFLRWFFLDSSNGHVLRACHDETQQCPHAFSALSHVDSR
eukprot:s1254_g15.t1